MNKYQIIVKISLMIISTTVAVIEDKPIVYIPSDLIQQVIKNTK